MKVKNFMKKAIAFCLGLAMTAGVGYGIAGNGASEVDADNYTLFYSNNCPKNASNSGYANNYNATIGGIDWNAPGNQFEDGAWRIGGKAKDTYDRTLYTKTSIDAEIGKIDFVTGTSSLKSLNSIVLDVYSTAADAASGSASNKISSVIAKEKYTGFIEGKEKDAVCCICGEQIDGYGNNPEPYTVITYQDVINKKFVPSDFISYLLG